MSATNMKLFLLVGFSLLLHREIEGITTHSVTGCSDRVLLNCSITEMIHVERITFYNGTDCNQAVTDLQVCGQPLTGIDTELLPMCNGKTTCNEVLHHSYCPGSKAARVDYRCIPGKDIKDMCEEFIIENTNRIFLSTPNFPLSPTFTDISPCRCFIRGSSITSIQILELVLHTSDDGSKSSLEISYGDVTYKTESFHLVVNKRLSAASTTAEITLNHNGINEQHLWTEVQGVGMRVHCNTNAKNVESSSPSPSSSSTTCDSQTPDIKSDSQGITSHSLTGCSDIAVLNCSITEMIHVERITYYNGTDCNQAVTDLQVCGQPETGSDTGLIPMCNGKTTCNEILHHSYCPGSKVDYRCIPGSDVKDMCDEFIIKDTNGIFLSTPLYPSSPSFTDIISPCRCSIRGTSITSIQIQILELILHKSNDGNKSRLEINYGNVTYTTESFNVVVNKRLSAASTTAEITLNHNGINEQHLWTEVQGADMRVSCNNDATHSSQTANTTSKSQDKDTTIIILAVLLSLCLLIISITAITNIVLLRKKKMATQKIPYSKVSE